MAVQCNTDENIVTNCLASLKFGERWTITTECFNTADAHKLIRDHHVIQGELLGMKLVQKKNLLKLLSARKKKFIKI